MGGREGGGLKEDALLLRFCFCSLFALKKRRDYKRGKEGN